MKSVVIGTAGHIDHGKSSLVLALTGTDPDRLKEEKARGITIDLGFAHARVGDVDLAFVDVPGHERFVKNMLAGVGGIDAVLLVIAADESVMPQTREHFAICRLLQIPRGVIAVTKTDLVDADTIELVTMEARAFVAGSALADAPIVPVSARTGAGLDALRSALAAVASQARPRVSSGAPRLPIDRVFSMRGFGTVVTGTLTQGTLRVDDEMVLLPSGRTVKVRGLQVHGAAQATAPAGRRVAVNLGGVDVDDVQRGDTLTAADAFDVTRRFDAIVELLPDARPLRHGARVRFHHGTAELLARVGLGPAAADTTDTKNQAADGTDTTDTKNQAADGTDTTDTKRQAADGTDTTDTKNQAADGTDTTDTKNQAADGTDTTDTKNQAADGTDTTDTKNRAADGTDTTDTKNRAADGTDYTNTKGQAADSADNTGTKGQAADRADNTDKKGQRTDSKASELQPGQRCFARFRLEAPAVLTRGDRFVLRQYSPSITIGGGVVLDPLPARTPIRTEAAAARFARLAGSDAMAARTFVEEARGAGITRQALLRRAGALPDGSVVAVGERLFGATFVAEREARLLSEIDAYHRAQPMAEGMPREEARERVFGGAPPMLFESIVQRLMAAGRMTGRDRLGLPGRGQSLTTEETAARSALDRVYRDAGLAPPDVASAAASAGIALAVADRVSKLMLRQKTLVRVDTLLLHADALERLKQEVRALKGSAAKVDVAAFKERYGLSRKYAIPLLEWLDRERVTRRVGDARVIL